MALIVGLGNPGQEYEGTRHNIGFELIDTLSNQLKIPLKPGNGPFIMGEGRFKGQNVYLLKPATFMNHSGKAVTKVLAATGESTDNCIICYDDINLEVGTIRLRPSGSAAGHNGLADILNRLGTQQISRLRMGIGNDFSRGKQVDYVLSPFSPEQRIEINQALEVASDAILTFLRGGINLAMNEFN